MDDTTKYAIYVVMVEDTEKAFESVTANGDIVSWGEVGRGLDLGAANDVITHAEKLGTDEKYE